MNWLQEYPMAVLVLGGEEGEYWGWLWLVKVLKVVRRVIHGQREWS
jgi:hypothetical protein